MVLRSGQDPRPAPVCNDFAVRDQLDRGRQDLPFGLLHDPKLQGFRCIIIVNRDRLLPALRRFAMIDEAEEAKLRAVKEDKGEEKVIVAMAEVPSDDFSNTKSEEPSSELFEDDFKPSVTKDLTTSFKPDDLPELLPKKNEAAITVEQTPAGIRLTIQDLQFEADSAKLLPGETKRLDNIAAVLKEAGQSQFLIEGHTARVGGTEGEMELSLARAHAIAEALAKRGIQAGRFICKGSGGNKPVADNSTPEGRARNRRVEITILE